MSYRRLIQSQRYQIATLHKAGFASRHIAEVVGCHGEFNFEVHHPNG